VPGGRAGASHSAAGDAIGLASCAWTEPTELSPIAMNAATAQAIAFQRAGMDRPSLESIDIVVVPPSSIETVRRTFRVSEPGVYCTVR
jgi:hypothetical protein